MGFILVCLREAVITGLDFINRQIDEDVKPLLLYRRLEENGFFDSINRYRSRLKQKSREVKE